MNAHAHIDEIDATATSSPKAPLVPNKADIAAHLHALFAPAFVHPYPESWIEIAYGHPGKFDGAVNAANTFSAFEIEKAVAFAERKNKAGYNIYVGAALRHGEKSKSGRASGRNVLNASHAWAEFDGADDEARIKAILKEKGLTPAIVVTTGTVPHLRAHLYFKFDGAVTFEKLKAANTSLKTAASSDDVQNPDRVLRLAGTVSYPSADKRSLGYVAELTTLYLKAAAPAYKIDSLIGLDPMSGATPDPFEEHGKERAPGQGRSDAELIALLRSINGKDGGAKKWRNPMLQAIGTMIGRGWPDSAIKMTCAPYCDGGADDEDLKKLIEDQREDFKKPNIEDAPSDGDEDGGGGRDMARMNKVHAVLPIGGKTRVVTFGELPDFPGRETIVMTQTFADFNLLQNKYRHTWRDKDGLEKSSPLGSYWIGSPQRRQYDGGMAFMPKNDARVVGKRLNLWNGFGVKPIKPDGTSGTAGCKLFLDFMREVICSGDEEHFDYLLKREATIFQKRIRSEIALGLRTEQEGCGKGFYEHTMGHLLGNHAMQVSNPKHIVGAFNPHLESLLRLTADEALFVGSHEHRNALFGLITEAKLTIEPKGLGVYQADSFLNLSITSNAAHFLPVSGTARRFMIPTVSTAHMQDFAYFNAIKDQLDHGGYEALLYHLLNEVDLTSFNVRLVPNTAGLREQRDQSLPPLEAWWCELLETGTITGGDPAAPHRAVCNSYQRQIEIDGGYSSNIRHVAQHGLYDQARLVEPRLRNHFNDHKLGGFLREMGCDNTKKVLRRQGWSFPPLLECRAKWEVRYPGWKWRDTEIAEWQAEEADDPVLGPRLIEHNPSSDQIDKLVSTGRTNF
jgi:hypothetical protein